MSGPITHVGWRLDAAGRSPEQALVDRDAFVPVWLARRHKTVTTVTDDSGTTWHLAAEGPFHGEDLADLAWLESEGFNVQFTARSRPRRGSSDREPYLALRITTTTDDGEQR